LKNKQFEDRVEAKPKGSQTKAKVLAPVDSADTSTTLNKTGVPKVNTDLSDNLQKDNPKEIKSHESLSLKHRISLIQKLIKNVPSDNLPKVNTDLSDNQAKIPPPELPMIHLMQVPPPLPTKQECLQTVICQYLRINPNPQ
jgi:hypothetical protein